MRLLSRKGTLEQLCVVLGGVNSIGQHRTGRPQESFAQSCTWVRFQPQVAVGRMNLKKIRHLAANPGGRHETPTLDSVVGMEKKDRISNIYDLKSAGHILTKDEGEEGADMILDSYFICPHSRPHNHRKYRLEERI